MADLNYLLMNLYSVPTSVTYYTTILFLTFRFVMCTLRGFTTTIKAKSHSILFLYFGSSFPSEIKVSLIVYAVHGTSSIR
jgi:hypothetical protein